MKIIKTSVLMSAILVSTNSHAEEVYLSATLGKSIPENTDHFNDGTGKAICWIPSIKTLRSGGELYSSR